MDPLANNVDVLDQIINTMDNMEDISLIDPVIFDLLKSDDYKARFVGEYVQTKIRYNKLHKMLIKYEAGTLDFEPTCDISILDDQAYYMGNYLKQLEIRAEVEHIRLPKI